jgi:GT2 family glycosyltransferase
MQLSVIILNYNVRFFLEQCVASVQEALSNIEGEIIVVDNDSSDDSCEMIKSRFPNVKLIKNNSNLGFPKGNNIGVAQAKGDYICILNPDTVVAEDTFDRILAFAEKQENLGIVGCKLIDGSGNFLPESKRGIPTPFVALTKIFGLYKLFPNWELFNRYYAQHLSENETGKVDILVGAFMIMKRNLYNEIGGFDENCFMYSDDIDLSFMSLKSGKNNYYFHETSVIHYKGESTVKDGLYMKRFREAMQFFYKKHYKSSPLFDFFMKMGTLFFVLIKKNQGNSNSIEIDDYILISEDENLKNKLVKQLNKKLIWETKLDSNTLFSLRNKSKKQIEFLIDNNSFSFKSIISFLETHKNQGFTFKIIPKNALFMIGSNNSNDRGIVVKID